ncbi:MAG: hypothetical protein HZA25_00765, partial [Candidatus Niyogibacteria bacterium]|nr:hypothetical protein [Candidatus Niyogibacteria bacterium]
MENNWHAKTIEEVIAELDSDVGRPGGYFADLRRGLSDEERKYRLKKYGHNVLQKERRFATLRLFWDQIKNPLVFILIAAGGIAAFLNEWADALVIAIAVVINAAIGMYQEGRADQAFAKLKSSIKKYSIVLRGGREHKIDSEMLVPGDIIVVRAGDGIGADARIIEVKGLSVNESVLTGEWLPSEKFA